MSQRHAKLTMTSFMVSVQDEGKSNVALKFSKDDGILKYYNESGDFSCFVQATPSVDLEACLITNNGTVINLESFLGKNKKKTGCVFQTYPSDLKTDKSGRCSFRCHLYTSSQNCKCLFFMVRVSWQINGVFHCFLSSPFVGCTKDPNPYPIKYNFITTSYLSNISYESFVANNQLTTMIIHRREKDFRDESYVRFNDNRRDETPEIDTNIITLAIHKLSPTEEMFTYYKEIADFSTFDLTVAADCPPDASYRVAKARSVSHQYSDTVEAFREVNDAALEKRAKVFVTQLLSWEKRGQISPDERNRIITETVQKFDSVVRHELQCQMPGSLKRDRDLVGRSEFSDRGSQLLGPTPAPNPPFQNLPAANKFPRRGEETQSSTSSAHALMSAEMPQEMATKSENNRSSSSSDGGSGGMDVSQWPLTHHGSSDTPSLSPSSAAAALSAATAGVSSLSRSTSRDSNEVGNKSISAERKGDVANSSISASSSGVSNSLSGSQAELKVETAVSGEKSGDVASLQDSVPTHSSTDSGSSSTSLRNFGPDQFSALPPWSYIPTSVGTTFQSLPAVSLSAAAIAAGISAPSGSSQSALGAQKASLTTDWERVMHHPMQQIQQPQQQQQQFQQNQAQMVYQQPYMQPQHYMFPPTFSNQGQQFGHAQQIQLLHQQQQQTPSQFGGYGGPGLNSSNGQSNNNYNSSNNNSSSSGGRNATNTSFPYGIYPTTVPGIPFNVAPGSLSAGFAPLGVGPATSPVATQSGSGAQQQQQLQQQQQYLSQYADVQGMFGGNRGNI